VRKIRDHRRDSAFGDYCVRAGIRILARLVKLYGRGNWRKVKGEATVRLEDGTISDAEIHWFEAHGIGKRRMKIKRLLS